MYSTICIAQYLLNCVCSTVCVALYLYTALQHSDVRISQDI